MLLSFTTPILASISARFILHENLKIVEIAGIACSFYGVIFILRSKIGMQGTEEGQQKQGIHKVYVVLIGLLSSLTNGLSYCLIRAGAKPSDQPVGTIFSFGLLSSPVAAICMITFEDFVLPSFYSFLLMIIRGIFAFIAELFLARGLQLEKTSKVANVQYLESDMVGVRIITENISEVLENIKNPFFKAFYRSFILYPFMVALTQLWGLASSRATPSFGRLVGCFIILVSVCCTVYFGAEKDME